MRRGKRSHSTPAEKRSNTTNITTGDDFVPISDANVNINVEQLVRSAPEEQKQDASDAGNLQTEPTSLSITNPGAINPASIIQNPIVTEEGFSSETPPRRVTRSMVRAASPSRELPTQPTIVQLRRGRANAVEAGVIQPLQVVNQPVPPFPSLDLLPNVVPASDIIHNLQSIPVVSSTAISTIPTALNTALNVPVQQNNDLIGIISQPITSIAQNPVISSPVNFSQVSQMGTSAAAASAPVGPTQQTDQRISELEAYMKRMESLLIQNLSANHPTITPTVDSTSNLPQNVHTTTSLLPQQGTSSRPGQTTRPDRDSDDKKWY